jgi:hypothetical protein
VAKGCTSYLAALLGLDISALRYRRGAFSLDVPAALTVALLSLLLARSMATSSRFNIVVSGEAGWLAGWLAGARPRLSTAHCCAPTLAP